MREKIEKIIKLLHERYGAPRPYRKSDPVDELIRTILSQNTTDKNSLSAFRVLKKNFKSWDRMLQLDARQIASLIRHAGLANIKARRIKAALEEIERREGKIGLSSLGRLDLESSLEYLMSLKGVGPKTAACVLLFSFGKPVMPVDTHIFRVTRRLGLIDKKLNVGDAQAYLSGIVPKNLIYDFHLGIIEHGRKTCKAQYPRCGICVLYGICKFEKKTFFKKRGLN